MERLTTRHCGVAVIKDKNLLKEAMEKIVKLNGEEVVGIAEKICRQCGKKFSQDVRGRKLYCRLRKMKWKCLHCLIS